MQKASATMLMQNYLGAANEQAEQIKLDSWKFL